MAISLGIYPTFSDKPIWKLGSLDMTAMIKLHGIDGPFYQRFHHGIPPKKHYPKAMTSSRCKNEKLPSGYVKIAIENHHL